MSVIRRAGQQILRDTVAGASESQAFMNNLYESGLTAKATLEYTGELNEKAKAALRLLKNSYSQCMKENIVTLLDYLKFELDTINENQ